ncbi:extracellular solute-binding protein [Halorientalis halophila]|uniref:extracellular solute-binding protein n=1 Tax=Halorientalis halophila TaxID=3108499 RepID=UPI0030098DC8
MKDTRDTDGRLVSRRRLLQSGAVAGTAAVAGCGLLSDDQATADAEDTGVSPEWIGSGPGEFGDRPEPGGTSMGDMPDLSGEITVYSGRGESLVKDLFDYLQETRYPNLTIDTNFAPAADLAATIREEGGNSPADVFFTVNAGTLGQVKSIDATQALTSETASLVDEAYRDSDDEWIGTSGRARTVPYNTDRLSASDVPESIMSFPDLSQYEGEIGWAPTYGSFKAFITAMRIIEGEDPTRQWLQGMQDLNTQEYSDEAQVARAVADGELAMGLTNHYYIQRELAVNPNEPLGTAFTRNDAGTIFNVAGAARLQSSGNPELADLFVRHLLSAEAQEYFAIRTFEYPLVDGVNPVGRLPSVTELSVPDIDLSQLADQAQSEDLLEEVGVL